MTSEKTESLKKLIKEIEDLRNVDIRYDNLGIKNGFHEADTAKKYVLGYLIDLLNKIVDNIGNVDESLITNVILDTQGEVRKIIQEINRQSNAMKSLVGDGSGVHNVNYPAQRETSIATFKSLRSGLIGRLLNLKLASDNAELLNKYNKLMHDIENNEVGEIKSALLGEVDAVKADRKQVADLLEKTKDIYSKLEGISTRGVEVFSTTNYDSLRDHHGREESKWYWIFIASSALTVCAVFLAIFGNGFTEGELYKYYGLKDGIIDQNTIWYVLVKNFMLISLFLLFMRISLTKHNLERNLRIIYSHRISSMNIYFAMEDKVEKMSIAQQEMRLEVIKMFFSDPRTGYNIPGKSNDLNINPIVSTIEKVAGK